MATEYTKVNIEQLNTLATNLKNNSNKIYSSINTYNSNLRSIEESNYLQGIAEDAITSSCERIRKTCEEFKNLAESLVTKISEISKETEEIDKTEAKKEEEIFNTDPTTFNGTSNSSSSTTTAETPSSSGTSMDIPSGNTSYKSYTNIDALRSGTPQSAIANGGEEVPYGTYKGNVYNTQTDPETGIRYVTFDGSDEKYYCAAMGTYYGEVGDTLKVTTDEGNSFNVILTDVKGSDAASYGNSNLSYYHPKDNNKCVVEFYIDYPADAIKVPGGTTGNYNDCSQFSGNITSIEKLS